MSGVTGIRGVALIKRYEACPLVAYFDSKGKCTIGYGHTKTARPGMVIDQNSADRLLAMDLLDAEADVNELTKVSLSASMFDALVSWTFNLGGRRLSESTMLQRLNEGRYIETTDEMTRWYKTPGAELGLKRRRLAEASLFLEDPMP